MRVRGDRTGIFAPPRLCVYARKCAGRHGAALTHTRPWLIARPFPPPPHPAHACDNDRRYCYHLAVIIFVINNNNVRAGTTFMKHVISGKLLNRTILTERVAKVARGGELSGPVLVLHLPRPRSGPHTRNTIVRRNRSVGMRGKPILLHRVQCMWCRNLRIIDIKRPWNDWCQNVKNIKKSLSDQGPKTNGLPNRNF